MSARVRAPRFDPPALSHLGLRKRPIMSLIQRLYCLLISAASKLQSPFLLVVRLAWGYQMHIAGDGKLHDLAKVTGFFTQLGIPLPGASALFIAVLEFAGGLLFLLGLGSRLIALLLS